MRDQDNHQRPIIQSDSIKDPLNSETLQKYLQANNLAKLLEQGEQDIAEGRTRSLDDFLNEFMNAKKILANQL